MYGVTMNEATNAGGAALKGTPDLPLMHLLSWIETYTGNVIVVSERG